MKTLWILDQLCILARILDRVFLDVRAWVLNEIWIIDLSSALVGMLMSSSKLSLFQNKAHLNSGVRLLLELYCVIVIKHQASSILKNSNNGIHI